MNSHSHGKRSQAGNCKASESQIASDIARNETAIAVRPMDALPVFYKIQQTKEFYEQCYGALCTNPSALAPSPHRVDHWRKMVGDELWARRRQEANAVNQKGIDEYECQLAEVVADNKRIDRLNEKMQEKYHADLASYAQAEKIAAAQCRSDEEAKERRKKAEAQLRQSLRDELASQEKNRVVEKALRDIGRRAGCKALLGIAWPLWLALFSLCISLCVLEPMWVGAAALPLYLLTALLAHWQECAINSYRRTYWKPEFDGSNDRVSWQFFTYCPVEAHDTPKTSVYTPIHILPRRQNEKPREQYPLGRKEENSRPEFNVHLFFLSMIPGSSLFSVLWCCFWLLDVYVIRGNVDKEVKDIYLKRRNTFTKMLNDELRKEEIKAYLEGRPPRFSSPPLILPELPRRPFLLSYELCPSRPEPVVPEHPSPPNHCYDSEEKGDYSHTLRGAMVYSVEEIRTLARYDLFAHRQIVPYHLFGDIPFPILSAESASVLIMGAAGSGKTKSIRAWMSALTPLTASQVRRIVDRSPDASKRAPASSHEWSRSRIHQAVVYNAKEEYIPFLTGLGFNVDTDLFILDPADTRCWCWDVATDYNDRDSIAQFAVLLTPLQGGTENRKDNDIWEYQARRIIEAVIISLRNAAFRSGEEPDWTLRDLRDAVAKPEKLRHVLQFHDTPDAIIAQLLDLSDAQKSSVYMSATLYISKIGTAAERWEEARRQGRVLSLKQWAKQMPGTVVVLPDTQINEYFNGPIVQILFQALIDLCVTHEYSAYFDSEGHKHYYLRYFFIDEFGEAGRLPSIKRLLSQGRSFNQRVVAGVHQLSQVQETYGEKLATSILGHFPYQALLRTDYSDTAEWMSKRIGDRLESYDKEQFQFGVSDGQTYTESQNETQGESVGTNQSSTKGETEGSSKTHGTSHTLSTSSSHASSHSTTFKKPFTHSTTSGTTDSRTINESTTTNVSTTEQSSTSSSETVGSSTQRTQSSSTGKSQAQSKTKSENRTHSKELRGERAVLASEFLKLPSPRKCGHIHGYYISPDYPVWKAVIPFESLEPVLENPSALDETPEVVKRTVQEDERVSSHKPWTAEDYIRLCITEPSVDQAIARSSAAELSSHPKARRSQRVTTLVDKEAPRTDLPHDFNFA